MNMSKYTPSTNTDVFSRKQLIQWESDNTPPQKHRRTYEERRERLWHNFGTVGESSSTWEWAYGLTRRVRRLICLGHLPMPQVVQK